MMDCNNNTYVLIIRMAWTQSRAVEKQIAVLGRQSGAGSTFPLLCFTCQLFYDGLLEEEVGQV
jgi:hypothetical protein